MIQLTPDPWAEVSARCQRDARAYVDSAIIKARSVGHTGLSGAVDGLTVLYGQLMASNARMTAQVESLRKRGWLRRLLGRKDDTR